MGKMPGEELSRAGNRKGLIQRMRYEDDFYDEETDRGRESAPVQRRQPAASSQAGERRTAGAVRRTVSGESGARRIPRSTAAGEATRRTAGDATSHRAPVKGEAAHRATMRDGAAHRSAAAGSDLHRSMAGHTAADHSTAHRSAAAGSDLHRALGSQESTHRTAGESSLHRTTGESSLHHTSGENGLHRTAAGTRAGETRHSAATPHRSDDSRRSSVSTRRSADSGRSLGAETRRSTRSSGDTRRSTAQTTHRSSAGSDNKNSKSSYAARHAAREKNLNGKRKGHLIAMIAIEAVILIGAVVVLFVVSRMNKITTPNWGKISIQHNEDLDEEVLQAMAEGYTDIMIFGVDTRMISQYNTMDIGAGADVNILAHINNQTGEVKLVSFFRDLWVKGDDGRYRKLADEYRRGGAAAALNTINRNFDLNVNTFVTSNWYAAAVGVNMLGGVDVYLPDDALGQFNGMLTETVDETGIGTEGQIWSGGMHHLDGPQTVAYCRIRKIDFEGYDYGDFGRAQRQREVLGLLLGKAKQLSLPELAGIVDALLSEVYTNVDANDVFQLASRVNSLNVTGFIGFPYEKDGALVDVPGYDYPVDFVAALDLEANVLKLHQELYGTDDGYEVSNSVQDISYYMYSNYGF